MSDLISVVVPIYNVEKYLTKCIDSIINQTYKNLEIILVDDGSPDNCGKICDEYKKKDNRIKVIHKKNGGLSDARNEGIKIATGKYIGFIDSDDFVNLKMIEILYDLLKNNNADISVVSYKYYFGEEENNNESVEIKSPKILSNIDAITYLFDNNKLGNYAWNKLYKLSLFDDVKYPVGKKMEDLGTTYKLFSKSNKIVYSDTELYYYLQRGDSILHSVDKKLCNDKFELCYERFLDLKKDYPNLEENNIYMFKNALRSYPFLNEKNREKAEGILKTKVNIKLTLGLNVRYILYRIDRKLYSNIFIKRGLK